MLSFASEFEVCLGNGSQDVLTKAFEALINPGDHMLIESPAYVGKHLSIIQPSKTCIPFV